jgi:hypothetical protein
VHVLDPPHGAQHDPEFDDPSALVAPDDVDPFTYVPSMLASNSRIAVSSVRTSFA